MSKIKQIFIVIFFTLQSDYLFAKINNSIVVKDICEDFNQLNASLYTLSCKDVSTEEFLDDLRLISTDILTLYKKIGQKSVSHSHRTFD